MQNNVLVHYTSDGTLSSLEIKCVICDHFFLITKTAAAETFSNLWCVSGIRYDISKECDRKANANLFTEL